MTVLDGEIVRGDMVYAIPGASVALNVFFWQLDGSSVSDAAVIAALAAWGLNDWGVPWADLATTTGQISRIELQKVTAGGLTVANIGTAIVNRSGNVISQVMPAAVSGYLQSDLSGTTRTGRKYVPGMEEGGITDGLFTPNSLALLADLLDAWQLRVAVDGSNDLIPCVLSKALLLVRLLLFSGLISDVPAYQRRRKPGVGI